MLIPCPICGARDHAEFTYGGDALPRPEITETDAAPWAAYVYDRTNPRGPHLEYWHHLHGCRHWLVVARDTETHAVGGVRLVGAWGVAPPRLGPADEEAVEAGEDGGEDTEKDLGDGEGEGGES